MTPCLVKEEATDMWEPKRRVALDLLMAGWGLGTWLGVNGLYVQLPLLVDALPEGWALPASMTLVIQLANLGPLLYAITRRVCPRITDATLIYGLLAIGTLALFLNGFFYSHTMRVASGDISFAFLALSFFAALVGCSSSVLFYPYLRHYRSIYLTTYLVGEGLSGFIPSLVALVQGVGGEPKCITTGDGTLEAHYSPPLFSIAVFMFFLSGLSAVSFASFAVLDNCSTFEKERLLNLKSEDRKEKEQERESLIKWNWFGVLILTLILNAVANGVLPSVASYACMPYGVRAYHLATTLGAMANPAACLLGVWLAPISVPWLSVLMAGMVPVLGYITAASLLSPNPPLVDVMGGAVLVVICWVVLTGAVSYGRMWALGWARRGGARGMRAAGVATQLGSAVGSVVLFALVQYTDIFVQPPACPA